jgi:hypothetical protein
MIYHLGNIWVFGGYGTGVILSDIFILQIDQLKWERVEVFGSVPDPR